MGSVQSRIKSSRHYVNGGDKRCRDATEVILESEEEEGGGGKEEKPIKLSFKSFYNRKKNGVAFYRGNKITKSNTIRRVNNSSAISVGTTIVTRRRENSQLLTRVPSASRILTRLSMARSMRKTKSIKQKESGSSEHADIERSGAEVDEELCKKRIIMGEKCRPLNHSGTLRYGEDGLLLPEIIP